MEGEGTLLPFVLEVSDAAEWPKGQVVEIPEVLCAKKRCAAKYCRNFRLAGYSDWRLATVAELKIIYDRSANAPGLSGPDNGPSTWHVKGNLFLTGYQWSSERRNDDRGHPTGYAWYFDFNDGRSNNQPSGFLYSPSFMRALCVRGSGK